MKRAFVFPGQGSQAVGMGKDLAEAHVHAREVFEEVDDALSQSLTRIMFEGPEDKLTLTENAQPALMAVSLAVVRVIEREGGRFLAELADFVAGHSLGEYSALAAVQALSLTDTARLLKIRGQAMQKAVPVGEGAMAVLLGIDIDDADEIAAQAAEDGVCSAANDNAPGQVVVSGDLLAVERAMALAKDQGAKRAMLLPVSAPFHCALMEPAAREMEHVLADANIAKPTLPVISNVTARAVVEPEEIRRRLVEQVTGTVRWRESMLHLGAQDVDELVELGAGKVLGGLAKRIDRSFNAQSLGTPDTVEVFLKSL
ncbi:MAG TPA: ACP S-malonyltransferase [Sneathiellales bacterium]|jgi:[acyl-carrier-protein] S-malonyltransferase|nr:ACP S-malonyltransferase [Sneathiellales bacterium]